MPKTPQPLVIKDFQNAISDSPSLGHSLMRNIDIESFPGNMKTSRKNFSMANLITTRTFTTNSGGSPANVAQASGDLRTQAEIDAGNLFASVAVTFSSSGTLPSYDFGGGGAPLVAGTVYYITPYSGNNDQFYVSDTLAHSLTANYGSVTSNGTGTHTVTAVAMGTINWLIRDKGGLDYYFALDSNGRVWHTRGGNIMYLLTGNTLTGTAGNGIVLFQDSNTTIASRKTWLFVFRNNAIDYVEVTSDTTLNAASWSNAWKTMNSGSGSGNRHHAIVGQDNIVYFTDAQYVGSLLEKPGSVFDPTSSGTYTYNNQALQLPGKEYAYCLAELGVNLLVGGNNFNKIYPWDRSAVSFALPLLCPENKIFAMINSGNLVYILAGIKGNIYNTSGSYVRQFAHIPVYASNNSSTLGASFVTWGGIAIRAGAIIVGLSTLTANNSGIWIVYPDGRVLQDNTPYGGSQNVPAIYAEGDDYLTGYAGNVDYSAGTRYAAGTFASVFNSALFRIGNKTQKATYSNLEIQIAKPATSGRIRVGWRPDESSAFTVLQTFVADGTTTSFEFDCGLIDIENIQSQLEFDGDIEIMQLTFVP